MGGRSGRLRPRMVGADVEPVSKVCDDAGLREGPTGRPSDRLQRQRPRLRDIPGAGYRINSTIRDGLEVLRWVPPHGQGLDDKVPEDQREHVTFSSSAGAFVDTAKRLPVCKSSKEVASAKPYAERRHRRRLVSK